MALLGEEEGSSRRWQLVGGMGVIAGILILSYYSVIAGWTLAYIMKSAMGVFTGADAGAVGAQFSGFVGDWRAVGLCHTLFMALTIFVVARGVERGLDLVGLLAHAGEHDSPRVAAGLQPSLQELGVTVAGR
jgi:NSS family neurotransmitter:Na+ symporter